MLKIIPNPDPEFLKEITQRVIENDGYCPCLLYKNEDTKCMCKDFREQNQTIPAWREPYCLGHISS